MSSTKNLVLSDYVLKLNGNKEVKMTASCWPGGERGEGCAAFPSDAQCNFNQTSYCLLFKAAVPVGDVILKFDWEQPSAQACHLIPDRTSGWRKEMRASGFWGQKVYDVPLKLPSASK